MKVVFGIHNIKRLKNAVVALGVFDGVHLAHQRILRQAVSRAKGIKGKAVVVTFDPHPQKKKSIYSLEHRLRLIASLGIDTCVVIRFSPAFAETSPGNFIKNILLHKIKAKYIFIGKNFRFGRGAAGDFKTLKSLARRLNFKARVFPVLRAAGSAVSSTYIRYLIASGKLKTAEKLLGRRVSVLGTVIKGTSLGRLMGFPTANINPHHEVLPPSGIYAVKIIYKDRELKGVSYIGTKPTFRPQANKS
ncbi:MAG: riboflavin kinase, partial [Candidatus Omnitrophota bacterium]